MTQKDEIKVVILEAESDEIKVIEKWEQSLENMQTLVGGYIEAVRLFDNVVLWINEEGKIMDDVEPNFYLVGENDKLLDLIMGDAIITGTNEEGDTVSLTDGEISKLTEKFVTRRHFNLF